MNKVTGINTYQQGSICRLGKWYADVHEPANFYNLGADPTCMGATEKQHSLVLSMKRVLPTFLLAIQLWLR